MPQGAGTGKPRRFPQNGKLPPLLNPGRRRSGQQPLARHMVELDPDAVRILEQQRVISRRPVVLARRANDCGIHRAKKRMELVDVSALARPEAQMMQADAVLVERRARML